MHVHDVLVIGAGPCGLAVAARMRERTPSATFTDDEHHRYHWIRKHGRKMSIKNYKTQCDSFSTLSDHNLKAESGLSHINMLVLDAESNTWMSRWHRLFKTFEINHLRSPMFFHVDPSDRDALLGYAFEQCRERELLELPGCVGKELSKHRKKKKWTSVSRIAQGGPHVDDRDRKDYYTPSNELFKAHCGEITKRYKLDDDFMRQERVIDIDYVELCDSNMGHDDSSDSNFSTSEHYEKVFCIETNQGKHHAHSVVLAIGPGNAPSIPRVYGLPLLKEKSHAGYAHAMQLKQFPPSHIVAKIKTRTQTSILIVGGGLTSAQLADLAIKRGVFKVYLLMRSGLKVKYFDVDLEWVGKFRNVNQASFWSADTDEERYEMLMKARNGGSITPRYKKILETHVKSGKVMLHTQTVLGSLRWDESAHIWRDIKTKPNVELPTIDYIVFATGIGNDVEGISFLDTIRDKYPIEYVGGLPCLNNDLMWCDDVPLFVTGRLAGLRLGPGAPNLVGARVGAERIVWNVNDILVKTRGHLINPNDESSSVSDGVDKMAEYTSGHKNRYDSLMDI